MIKHCIILLLTIFCNLCYGQKSKEDSLLNVYHSSPSGINKVLALQKVAGIYIKNGEIAKAEALITKLYKTAKELNDREAEFIASNLKGNLFKEKESYHAALEQYKYAHSLSLQLRNRSYEAFTLNQIATTLYFQGEFTSSLDYFHKSLPLLDDERDQAQLEITYNNIANSYLALGEYEDAIEYYRHSIAICIKNNHEEGLSEVYSNLGVTYFYKGELDKTLEYFHKSLELEEKYNDKEGIAGSLNNIAIIYKTQEKYEKALEYNFKSLKIEEELGNKAGIATSYNNIGNMYLKLNNPEKALSYFEKSLEIKEELGNQSSIANTLINLSKLYYTTRQYEKSEKALKETVLIKRLSNERQGLADALSLLGRTYMKLKKVKEAEEALAEALDISKEKGYAKTRMVTYKYLSSLDSLRGNFHHSLQHFYQFWNLYDSLQKEEKKQQIEELQEKYEAIQKDKEIAILNKENEIKIGKIKQQNIMKNILLLSLGLFLVLSFILYRSNRFKAKMNEILKNKNREIHNQKEEIISQKEYLEDLNEEIQQQKSELQKINELLSLKNQQIELKNTGITSSISYAQKIQKAILPGTDIIEKSSLNEAFVLYKAKDIVSGDFYWFSETPEHIFIACVDCTGHGVPGAFMSLIAYNILQKIIKEGKITDPGVIIRELDHQIVKALNQEESGNTDGIELALVVYDKNLRKAKISGSRQTFYMHSANGLEVFKCSRKPVGGSFLHEKSDNFHVFEVNLMEYGESPHFYFTTDGYADQFGGPYDRKFGKQRLRNLIQTANQVPLRQQKKYFEIAFNEWKGQSEQIDDVLVVGFRF